MNSVMLIQFAVMIVCVVIFQTVVVNYNKLVKAQEMMRELSRIMQENTEKRDLLQEQMEELQEDSARAAVLSEIEEAETNIRLCSGEYERIAAWCAQARTRGVTRWLAKLPGIRRAEQI